MAKILFCLLQVFVFTRCDDKLVDVKRPMMFDKDVYAALVDEPLMMVAYRMQSFTSDISFIANGAEIVKCTETSCPEKTNPSVTLKKHLFEIYFDKVEEKAAGLYEADYAHSASTAAKPIALVVVYRMPRCSIMLYDMKWNWLSEVNDIDSISEGEAVQLTCRTSSISAPDSVPPNQGWTGITNKLIKDEKTSKQKGGDMLDFEHNHTIIIAIDFTTRLDNVKCSLHLQDSISVPAFLPNGDALPMTNATKLVSCIPQAPNIMFCPLRVVVKGRRLQNGSTILTCMSTANPSPKYIWHSTVASFKATIGAQIVVDQVGFYICTAQTSHFKLKCHPQKALYHLPLSKNDVPLVFMLGLVLSLLVMSSAFILLVMGKNKSLQVLPEEEPMTHK